MAHKYLIFFIGLLITHKDEHFAKKKMHSNWMKNRNIQIFEIPFSNVINDNSCTMHFSKRNVP